MSIVETVLEYPAVYRAWQAPFAEQKFAPVLAHNDLKRVKRVLDVGCGPGTNTHHFVQSDYLGLDLNESYIRHARRRRGRDFIAADVREYRAEPMDKFDFILVNSFLHHVDTPQVLKILTHLNSLLTDDGHVHILELVMPPDPSVARLLARWDRGKFTRPVKEWEAIFSQTFEPFLFEPFPLTGMGMTLWSFVYFKGRPKK
ncbi:MAG: class I SAM-dependent methyltransferase [Terriglobales bacterium]